jgi:alpha-1,2-mannosyltransferase
MTNQTLSEAALTALNLVALMFGTLLLSQSLLNMNLEITGQSAQPVGKDFFCFWSAGRLALAGHAADIFNPRALAAFQQSYLAAPDGVSIPWFYPPLLLLYISCAFALLPYKVAYVVFLLVSSIAFVLLTRRYFPSVRTLHIVAFPAFWFNALSGQNGLLTAIILIGGLICLHSKPLVAGGVFAALSYKPQLCFAIPIFLLVERRYETIIAGAIALAALMALSTGLFGTAIWPAFIDGIQEARTFNHLSGNIKYESFAQLYGSLRVIGIGHDLATGLNYAFAAVATAAAIRFWLYANNQSEKHAVVILLSLLLAPHLIYYDFVVTGAAIVWLWHRAGLRPALGMIWAAPFIWPFVAPYGIPIFPTAATMILIQLNRTIRSLRSEPPVHS